MTNAIQPSEIKIGGVEKYSDDESILDAMSDIKKIDSSDSFQQQFVDLGGEGDPMVQFTSELVNANDQELVNVSSRNPNEDDSNEEGRLLQIYLDFPYESLTTFNATLNDILEIIGSLSVEYLQITYEIEVEFSSLNVISKMNETIEYTLQGIRIGEDEYVYTFQTVDEGTGVIATLEDEPQIGPDSNEDFIKDEVDTATRFVERVCNE